MRRSIPYARARNLPYSVIVWGWWGESEARRGGGLNATELDTARGAFANTADESSGPYRF